MKGLIYKEFYLARKSKAIVLVVCLLLYILCGLTRLSALYGNLSGASSRETIEGLAFVLMAIGIPTILYCSTTNSIFADEKTRFRQYSCTLPVSEREIAGSVFLVGVIEYAVFSLIGLAICGIAFVVFARGFELKYYWTILAIGALRTVVFFVNAAIAYRCRNPKKFGVIVGVTASLVYIAICSGGLGLIRRCVELEGYDPKGEVPSVVYVDAAERAWDALRSTGGKIWPAIAIIAAVVIEAAFHSSVKSLKRRGA